MANKNRLWLLLIPLIGVVGAILYMNTVVATGSIKLNKDALVMYTGYESELCLLEYTGRCTWTTDNPSIATVSDGTVTAHSPGETSLRCVSAEGETFSCRIEVLARVSDPYHELAQKEAAWIEGLQLSDGSFSCYEPEENQPVRINPYFSSYAALAVLKSDRDGKKKDLAEAYLNWYFSHMNTECDVYGSTGTVYDYQATVRNHEVISETCCYSYDSADSYCAVFLMLLWEYYDHYQDNATLALQKENIDRLVDLLLSLQSDGYTESFQKSNVKYLMNNMEAYQGMVCALKLYGFLWKNDVRTVQLADAVAEFESSFDSVWWNDGYYYSVLNANNQPFYGDAMDWGKLYEFAAPQLFPLMFGLKMPDDEQTRQTYPAFCQQWNWQAMEYGEEGYANQTWSLIAYAAVAAGDYQRADQYLTHFTEYTASRSYPYYSGDSAWVVLACERAFDYYTELERETGR